MPFAFFDAPGRFYRGNLHTHSTLSDGALAPEEVSRRYQAMGYDFYCLSDHFLARYDFPIADTRGHRNPGFTTLIGAELHAGTIAAGDIWHILAVGLPLDFPATRPDETGPMLARRALEAGAFVAIAHPQWYGLRVEDARQIDFAHAVEIYNHGCAVQTDRGDGAILLDDMWSEGARYTAIATDDAHFSDPFDANCDAFGGWVMVKARENTPDALLGALKAGAFYSSQGPELRHIAREGDEIVVETSAVQRVMLLGEGSRAVDVAGYSMTKARLPLKKFTGGWARLVAVDAAGRRAWSNPFTLM